jgi:hypothetical protein
LTGGGEGQVEAATKVGVLEDFEAIINDGIAGLLADLLERLPGLVLRAGRPSPGAPQFIEDFGLFPQGIDCLLRQRLGVVTMQFWWGPSGPS